jgi:hypothetical protein
VEVKSRTSGTNWCVSRYERIAWRYEYEIPVELRYWTIGNGKLKPIIDKSIQNLVWENC